MMWLDELGRRAGQARGSGPEIAWLAWELESLPQREHGSPGPPSFRRHVQSPSNLLVEGSSRFELLEYGERFPDRDKPPLQ